MHTQVPSNEATTTLEFTRTKLPGWRPATLDENERISCWQQDTLLVWGPAARSMLANEQLCGAAITSSERRVESSRLMHI